MQDLDQKAAQIRLIIFDVDGVLTDGSLFLGDDGQEYKAFHSKDGHGMVMLRQSGVEIAIITGRTSEVVRIRMASLGIEHVYQGRREKLPAYEELKQITGFSDQLLRGRRIVIEISDGSLVPGEQVVVVPDISIFQQWFGKK